MNCVCQTIGAPLVVRFCEEHHSYWRGDKRLASVSSVIREVWPVKPSWDGVDEAVIANARERGVECDQLFSGWINGTLKEIPVGTREDAMERFWALKDWWTAGPAINRIRCVSAQEILADDEIAGTADLVIGDDVEIWDVKNTAQIESTYSFQIAAYCDLYERQWGVRPKRAGVLHVTKPKDKPVKVKAVAFNLETALSEWRLMREFYSMVRRKTA